MSMKVNIAKNKAKSKVITKFFGIFLILLLQACNPWKPQNCSLTMGIKSMRINIYDNDTKQNEFDFDYWLTGWIRECANSCFHVFCIIIMLIIITGKSNIISYLLILILSLSLIFQIHVCWSSIKLQTSNHELTFKNKISFFISNFKTVDFAFP